jgi:hypothetical protein
MFIQRRAVMADRKQFPIVMGPSREELFDALRLRHEGREVTITASKGYGLPASPPKKGISALAVLTLDNLTVDSIGIEDGSGDNWILRLRDPNNKTGSKYLEGYFNTVKRTGWVRPVLP